MNFREIYFLYADNRVSRYGPLDPFIRLTFELMEKNEIGQWQTLPSSLNNRLDADNNFRRQICFLCTSICLGHLIHSSVDDSLPSADVNSTVLDLGMSFFYFHVKWCDSSGRLVQSDATTLRGIVPRHSSSESFQQSLFLGEKSENYYWIFACRKSGENSQKINL